MELGIKKSVQYKSKQLEHLGLIAGMYDELGIGELLDKLIPQNRIVSVGQAVKSMVLNGLGFANKSLYLSELFFRDKPVEHLIGKGIHAEHLNDDTLGRALDALYDYGVCALYPQLAAKAVKKLGLSCHFGHMDSTSFHVDGDYDNDEEEKVVQITRGYSRDHRPDLNQVVLQLITERQAGIPMLMQVLDGNNSDKVSFREMVNRFTKEMREDFSIEYVVADSALYTEETLCSMKDFLWISRVPESLSLAQEVIDTCDDLMDNPTQTQYRNLCTEYGGVKQRWIVVFSPEAHQRAIKTLNKQWVKKSDAELKALQKLCKQPFSCEADAVKALNKFKKSLKYTLLNETTINTIPRFKGKGRPAKDRQPDYFDYHIEAVMASNLQERTRRLQRKSCFILASNQLNYEALPNADLVAAYKDQQKVERGFRFLKDPMFMASTLYLKSPKRITALMMVMTLSLLVYAALEHRIRETLKQQDIFFPNQKNQLTQNPTARWVFQFFTGIQLLTVQHSEQVQTFVLNINEHQTALIKSLGERYVSLYTGTG